MVFYKNKKSGQTFRENDVIINDQNKDEFEIFNDAHLEALTRIQIRAGYILLFTCIAAIPALVYFIDYLITLYRIRT